jgi:hypothetical protein
MYRFHLLLLTSLLAASGCSKPNEIENPPQRLLVQGFLSPGKEAEIALRQTLAPDRYYEGLEDTVRQATVKLSVDDQTFVLSEDPLSPGTYKIPVDILPVEAGKTYHLTATQGEKQLRASTTVPFKSEITEVTADTITYYQIFGDLYGDLVHPGEFRWTPSANVAGYIIIVEAVDVKSLPPSVEPLTAELDTLLLRRQDLGAQVSQDSLETLDRQIQELRDFLTTGISRIDASGDTIRYLRDREEENWYEMEAEDWTEGRKWRKRREYLFRDRFINYWIPADSLRSDFWWLGVRFEGEYKITLQAADQNYFDYFTTSFNGLSGNDGDRGPLFHVQGGTGVFGSYAEDSRRVLALRGEDGPILKIVP